MQNDIQCHTCGLWFGSEELALLHLRVLHPTDVNDKKSSRHPNLLLKAISRTILWVVSTRRVGKANRSTSLPAQPRDAGHGHLPQPVPPRYTAAIYQNLLRTLAQFTTQLCDKLKGPKLQTSQSWDKCRESHDLLLLVEGQMRSHETISYLLASSHKYRIQLLNLASYLGCRDDNRIWDAIRKDDDYIIVLLREVLRTKLGQQAVLSLREDSAESFLNLIYKVLVEGSYTRVLDEPAAGDLQPIDSPGIRFRRTLHRISVGLSQRSDKLPESIYVEGLKILDKYSLNGGAFADVYKGEFRGKEVAVKKLRVTLYQPPDQRAKTMKALCREAAIWLHLEHPHVLPFLGIDRTIFSGSACMLSPWMHHGNVHDYIAANGFVETEVHRLLYQVADGLSYLHRENIVHGDLRGPNILVDENRCARLADFGLANFDGSTSGSASAHATGAIGWTAPELLSSAGFETDNPRPTTSSDIYSFGSVCWEVYTGKVPFHEFRMVQALTRIITGHRPTRPSGDHEMRQGLWATVKACWRHTPSTRPSAYKVLEFLGLYLQDPKILPNFPPSIDSAECSIMDAVAVPASCEPPAANCPVMLSSQHAAKPDDEEPNSPPPTSDCDTRPAEAESEALAVNHNE